MRVRSSIGVTLFPQDDSAPERLLRHADRALYALKESKDEPAAAMDASSMPRRMSRNTSGRRRFSRCFDPGNLRIYYQPVIDLQTGEVSGVEALARLANTDNTLLLPGDFLPQFSAADLVTLPIR